MGRSDPATTPAGPQDIDPAVARQAVELLLAWQDAEHPETAWQAITRWRNRHPQHERAWQQIERVNQQFQRAAISTGSHVVQHALTSEKLPRRAVLKGFAAVLLAAGIGLYSERERPWEIWSADHHTSRGGRKTVTLTDGTVIVLNSDTAVGLTQVADTMRVELLRGEIFLRTGRDRDPGASVMTALQITVTTEQGRLMPLGTRFSVMQRSGQTVLAVYRGEVQVVTAASGQVSQVKEGYGLLFDGQGPLARQTVHETDAAWTQGMIIARGMPLSDFLDQVRRYHPGLIRSAPELGRLKVSGTYPIGSLDPILAALAANLPLEVVRVAPFWTHLVPASTSVQQSTD